MVDFDLQRRPLGDLWIAIGIAVSMAVYHLATTILPGWMDLSDGWMFGLSNGLFAWILVLLWIAYRRWRIALRRQTDLRRILSSIATEVILVIDRRRRIRMVNDSVAGVFGRTPEEVIGRTTDLLYRDRRGPDGASIRDEMERIGFHVGRAVALRLDGSEFEVEITTALLRGHEGAVVMIKDITARRRAEQAILDAKHAAETASEERGRLIEELRANFEKLKELEGLRDSLTHMIVHDMRSPIQMILTNVELVLGYAEKPLAEVDRSRLLDAKARAEWLVTMTRSMLDVSRLEAHQLPLNRTVCDLYALAGTAVASCRPLAEGLDLIAPAGAPAMVSVDAELVGRVLDNLLVNAIKFSPAAGRVEVRIRAGADGTLRVEVADQGPGVPESDRERIFEKFVQNATAARKKAPHSVGLGLTFCKLAIEAHGGRIGLEPAAGGGSLFWFEVPSTGAPVTNGNSALPS